MANGIWTAASGASAQSQNLDVIANNLANADTPAYKKDGSTFKEYLATQERAHGPQDIPRAPFKDKDFYPLDGRDQSYVTMDGTYINHRQGSLRVTQAPFDLALEGPGFLEVSTPAGIRYTRLGSLKVNPDGRLVTSEGLPVLAEQASGLAGAQATVATPGTQPGGTPNLAARFIDLSDRGPSVSITNEGEIYTNGDVVAKLSVVEFKDPRKLRKTGAQLFMNPDPTNRQNGTNTLVRQGALETSNVNPVEEMANMIRANRAFEQDLKALKTYGELMGKEVNEVGKL